MKNLVHTIGILVLFFGKLCAQLTPALNWQHLTKTLNPSGSEVLNARPLQYNPELDLITFVHAASPFYQAAVPVPANTQSNVIVAQVSNNWGQSWDSTCVWGNTLRVEWEGMDQPLLLLRDIAGKPIWGRPLAAKKEIELSELQPGVYFLEFWNKNLLVTTKKILKQ